jgi:hypothetical protein
MSITPNSKPAPPPGIYRDVPFAEYEQWNAWNPSKIKTLLSKSPRALRYALDHGSASTAAMDTGKAAHMAILEPEKFADAYTVYEGGRRQGKAWEDFQTANMDKEIIKADEYADLIGMNTAVNTDPVAGPLLAGDADHEVSIVWIDPATGLLCKGRIDRLNRDGLIVDLKTTSDPYPHGFRHTFVKLAYHVSLAAYAEGLEEIDGNRHDVKIIAVQSAPPFEVIVYQPSRETVLTGSDMWRRGLDTVAECLRTGVWPGAETKAVPLDLPEWAVEQNQVTY